MITTLKNDMLSGLILGIFALGWMDTLWIFGVENSKEYTWWFLIKESCIRVNRDRKWFLENYESFSSPIVTTLTSSL